MPYTAPAGRQTRGAWSCWLRASSFELSRVGEPAPSSRRRGTQPSFRDHLPELLRKAPKAHLAHPEPPRFIARRLHAVLHPRDQLGVLRVYAAVDPPVEIAN